LLQIIRSAASCTHPLQESVVPRAALTVRVMAHAFTTDYVPGVEDWQRNLIEDDEERLLALLREAKRVAVLGIKTEAARGQPAFYVPQALQRMGLEIIPVPVYYPDAVEILGQKVYRKVADVPGDIDIVDVFRRSGDVAAHLSDLLAKKPKAVWLQSGIRDDRTAEALAKAGILVVQDRCLMVDYREVARSAPR
jgi:predicted CoA-binding protein